MLDTLASRIPYAMPKQLVQLPSTLPPRGLSRIHAAAYIGIAPTLFDELVKDGRMPRPVRINSRVVWDRIRLDEAFSALTDDVLQSDPWSKVAR